MFGILGAPDVDWAITLDNGRVDVAPGATVNATISFRPHGAITPRRVMAALVGTEDYKYREREMTQHGSGETTTWGHADLVRQEIQLLGPGPLGPGELRSGPVSFTVPADAPPSLESNVMRMRWRIAAWMDVGGRDPKAEQQLIVPLTVDRLNPSDAAGMGPQVQSSVDGQAVTFWTDPAPLRVGAPFSGAVDVLTPLPLGDTHVELRLRSASQMSGGIPGATLLALVGFASTAENGMAETHVLWRGTLTDGGQSGPWRRYLFAGGLPQAATPTAVYPHGVSTASFDVIISRRMRTDVHIVRPVAIVTG